MPLRTVMCSGVTGTGIQPYVHLNIPKGCDMGAHLIVDADSGVSWRVLACSPPTIPTAKAVQHIPPTVGGKSVSILLSPDMAFEVVSNTNSYSVNAVLIGNGD